MPLIECPDCGREISDRAVACPHCGRPGSALHDPYFWAKEGNLLAIGRWADEDIRWRVLAVEDSRVLLIADKGIDCQPFNASLEDGNDWDNSHLKRWLEEEFGPAAGLPSTPFCFSIEEAEKYFSNNQDRKAYPSAHAVEQGVFVNDTGTCGWWLRSAGELPNTAAYVTIDGRIYSYGFYVYHSLVCVRPAMWIEL